MSKASEYAARVQDAKNAPAPCRGGQGWNLAWVTESGGMGTAQTHLTSEDALRLAKWILDTFGDDE
jgi:hypothetical protein